MPLLPFQRLEIHSPLPAEEAAERLAAQVEPLRWFRFKHGTCAFEGSVDGSEFRIRRVIGYRNSFLPQIRGTISPTATGSRIDCRLSLHPFVIAFMVIWFGAVIAIGGAFVFTPTEPGRSPWFRLIPVAMLVFGWILATGPFAFEANRARHLLTELFGLGEARVR